MFYIHEKIQIILFLPPSKFGIVKVLIFFFQFVRAYIASDDKQDQQSATPFWRMMMLSK
jgi:lipid-A-disaccharide synthase-like uncharacterized protein